MNLSCQNSTRVTLCRKGRDSSHLTQGNEHFIYLNLFRQFQIMGIFCVPPVLQISGIHIIIHIKSQINVFRREIRRQEWTFCFSCCVLFFFQLEALVMWSCSSNLIITLSLGVTSPAGGNVSTKGSAIRLCDIPERYGFSNRPLPVGFEWIKWH